MVLELELEKLIYIQTKYLFSEIYQNPHINIEQYQEIALADLELTYRQKIEEINRKKYQKLENPTA